MKTTIKVDNEFLTISILRKGFIMAVVHFMSDNHGEKCECLTIGQACKLAALIINGLDNQHKMSERIQLEMEDNFSIIKGLINVGEANGEVVI